MMKIKQRFWAPYIVSEKKPEDIASWWGPYPTLGDAIVALMEIQKKFPETQILDSFRKVVE